jgi:GxxExxY protein
MTQIAQIRKSEETKDPRTFAIIGAAMAVHRELGCGFLEAVYQEAFALELAARSVPCRREVDLPVYYKGHQLNTAYRADFLCYNSIIVELKALARLSGTEEAQVINYLKASRHEVGVLLNFGAPSSEYKRLIFSPQITQIAQIDESRK